MCYYHWLDFLIDLRADLQCIQCLVVDMTLDSPMISHQIHQKIQPVALILCLQSLEGLQKAAKG